MSRTATKRRPPGPLGTVEKLPSGRFRAFYRYEGAKFPAPHTFATREAAQGWLATERADRALGTWRDPRLGQITLSEYATTWLDSRTALSARTIALYRDLLARRVLPEVGETGRLSLGRLALASITPALVRQWFARMSADSARDAGRPRRRIWQAGSTHGANPARAWAAAHGYNVAAQGRMPAAALTAWRAAGSPDGPNGRPRPASFTGQTTAAQSYRLLHAILAAAVADGLLTTNPATITGAGSVRHAERETATPDEVAALAAAMPANLRAAVWLAAWSGLRQGELLGLARRHVDLTAGSVRVERSLSSRDRTPGPTKTRGALRTVYLPAFVVEQLAAHLTTFTGEEPDALVFTNARGGAVYASHLLTAFGRARAAIGRPGLTWHDLRHTGATLAYQAGGSVRDVQRRLGHATERAAMIYAHIADDSDSQLAARLHAAFGPTPTPPATPEPTPPTVNAGLTPEPASPTGGRHLRAVPSAPERRAS